MVATPTNREKSGQKSPPGAVFTPLAPRLRATGVPSSPSAPGAGLPAPDRSFAGSGALRVKLHAMSGGGRQKMADIAPFFVSRALRFASHVGKTGPEAAQIRTGLRDTRKRDATGSPSRCGRLGSRYSPSFAKGPPRERQPCGWPPGCRRRKSRGRGPVPHAHSHGSRSALTRADPTASPTPHAHSRALRWPPCFGSHLPACRQPGAWIPPTPSVRVRLDHVCEA